MRACSSFYRFCFCFCFLFCLLPTPPHPPAGANLGHMNITRADTYLVHHLLNFHVVKMLFWSEGLGLQILMHVESATIKSLRNTVHKKTVNVLQLVFQIFLKISLEHLFIILLFNRSHRAYMQIATYKIKNKIQCHSK